MQIYKDYKTVEVCKQKFMEYYLQLDRLEKLYRQMTS